jgi:hypothetical protein
MALRHHTTLPRPVIWQRTRGTSSPKHSRDTMTRYTGNVTHNTWWRPFQRQQRRPGTANHLPSGLLPNFSVSLHRLLRTFLLSSSFHTETSTPALQSFNFVFIFYFVNAPATSSTLSGAVFRRGSVVVETLPAGPHCSAICSEQRIHCSFDPKYHTLKPP